jgi:eukaryotic-like serine/threonine-protein kinase
MAAGMGSTNGPLLEKTLDEQSALWRRGERLHVEAILEQVPALQEDEGAILDLLYHEIVLRHRAGESPRLEEYTRRFPELSDELAAQFQVHRALVGDTIRLEESLPPSSLETLAPLDARRAGDNAPALPGFEVLAELGRGGMGVVYKAREINLNRMVALKMILAGTHAGGEARRRFQREAEAVGRLRHPNIVQIHATGEHGGRSFLVLEYVEGGSLDQWQNGIPQPSREAAGLIETLARAMHAAHLEGVVHRDLKPANVLRTTDGTPKITDFGLAKQLESTAAQTQSGAILGTPSYMAPEQAGGKGKVVGPSADVYSLGAILYELLTGRPPFKGETSLETIQQVANDEPVPPRRLHPKVAPDLEIICLKCLQKEPRWRYATALAFADELKRFLDDQPIQARANSGLEHAWRWCRRNPALAAATALAVAGLLGVTGVSVLYTIRMTENTRRLGRSAENLQQSWENNLAIRLRAELRLAENYLERGRNLVEKGNGVTGTLFLARALQIAPGNEPSLQQSIRTQLGFIGNRIHPPRLLIPTPGPLTAVALSSDGRTLAMGTIDGKLQLCDARTGSRSGELLPNGSMVLVLEFSPDGSRLLSGSFGGTARLWDVATLKPIGPTLTYRGEIQSGAFSPDGHIALIGGTDVAARLFDAETGLPIGDPLSHPGGASVVKFGPGGKVVLTAGGGNSVKIWDAATSKPLGARLIHEEFVKAAAFSPNGRYLLTASGHNAALWDLATRKLVGSQLPHPYMFRIVVFSPDGHRFCTGSADGSARLWNTTTLQPIGELLDHQGGVSTAAFSSDGSMLLTGSDDRTARLWDARTAKPIGFPLQHEGEVWEVEFGPDGRMLTWGQDDPVRFSEVGSGTKTSSTLAHQNWVSAVAFSPDGKKALTGTSGIISAKCHLKFWDVNTGEPLSSDLPLSGPALAVAFSPDGRYFLSGCGNPFVSFGEAQLWNAATREPIRPPLRHEKAVTAVVFSPDSTRFLTASLDNTARLWAVGSGKELRVFQHAQGVAAAAFSPDGNTVSTGCSDNFARLWDVQTGKLIGRPLRHQDEVFGVAFSPDGRLLLTGSLDCTAQLWDRATGRPFNTPFRHKGWVRAVAFSPDGRTLLTGSADKSVQLWNTDTGKPIGGPLLHQDWVASAVFGPDGRSVLTGSRNMTARLWKVQTAVEGDIDRVVLWSQVVTGAELDDNDGVSLLNAGEWRERSNRLQQLGGPPLPVARAKDGN